MNIINLVSTLNVCQGTIGKDGVPDGIAGLVHLIVILLQVVTPIVLIIWGMFDFVKAIIGGDEEKIKAGQKTFVKRLIAAIFVFLIITIVQLVINAVGGINADTATGGDTTTVWGCAQDLINGGR